MNQFREKLPRIEEELREMIPRWKFIYWLLISAAFLLISRLWYLQILHGETLRQYSDRNRLKENIISAERGWILDRNYRTLVNNQQGLKLILTPQYIHNLPNMAEHIAPIIHKSVKYIIKKVKKSEKQYGPFRPVVIKKHLNIQQITQLKSLQWNFTGMDIKQTAIRHYPLKKNGAHLFGYMGEISKKQINKFKKHKHRFHFQPGDLVGKSGLESMWEHELRGEDGFSFVEVNVYNRKSSSNIAGLWSFQPKQPVRGHNLVLTIDKALQEKTYNSLLRNDSIGPRTGAVVVMKTNGEILAWCSSPAYDPNAFSIGLSQSAWIKLANDPMQPLRNKVIQNHYAPGSVFKPIVALAALQTGIITEDTLIQSPQHLIFNGRIYHDYRQTGYGAINILSAIERSANVFFYKLGIQIGIDQIAHYAHLLNLGKKTNIQLEEEIPGFIPNTQWKQKNLGEPWQPGENLSHAIGQGFILVTPLQMAIAYNAIATEGNIMQPFIVKHIIDSNNQVLQTFQPHELYNLHSSIDKSHFQTIKKALTRVVQGANGTAKWYRIKDIPIAGKTGTAQVISLSKRNIYKKCKRRPYEHRHHGWFVAFAPAEQPEIIVSVLTEHSCSGSSGSAPIARDIINFYFNNKKNKVSNKPYKSNQQNKL